MQLEMSGWGRLFVVAVAVVSVSWVGSASVYAGGPAGGDAGAVADLVGQQREAGARGTDLAGSIAELLELDVTVPGGAPDTLGGELPGWLETGLSGQDLADAIHDYLGVPPEDGQGEPPSDPGSGDPTSHMGDVASLVAEQLAADVHGADLADMIRDHLGAVPDVSSLGGGSSYAAIPEPTSIAILALIGIAGVSRRRRG